MKTALIVLALLVSAPLLAQPGIETAGSRTFYPAVWPDAPLPGSVPRWAQPGRIRFARWDGGPMEVAKYMLSGYPGYNPPIPDYIYAMTNWYDPRTVRLLREASINLVWVTFSAGFSNVTEKPQQDILRAYIDECHHAGIRVMAYESIANIFWEDFSEHVPDAQRWVRLDSDGKPIPYGAGDYAKMGRVTRYMANLDIPEWRSLLRERIDLAIDTGADGIMYDNNFGDTRALIATYQDIYRYAAARKSDLLMMANFHDTTYSLNRLINCMTTEDGVEPGVWSRDPALNDRSLRSDRQPLDGGFLVNNMGLFSIQRALSGGWRPAMVENGRRENGVRETTPMSGPRFQLSLAEGMTFGIASELFVEGTFGHDLFREDPKTLDIWKSIGRYNRFFADHEQYYVDTRSLARIAMILDDRSAGVALLNGLSGRRVAYDVIYERDLKPGMLSGYAAVSVIQAETLRSSALKELDAYARKGGLLYAGAKSGSLDENGKTQAPPAFFAPSGKTVVFEQTPTPEDLAAKLTGLAPEPIREFSAPDTVLYRIVEQPDKERLLIHVLNYADQPSGPVRIRLNRGHGRTILLSPDTGRTLLKKSSPTDLELPAVRVYSLLILESTDQ